MSTTPSFDKIYRPDIDGLRAIAVLAVVSFHAFPNWISGGYIGVDIFFLISGFLISRQIFGELETKSFSFLDFFCRRIRRIFPALSIVILASIVLGWFSLVGNEYERLGFSVLAGAAFFSNFALISETGYFDYDSLAKPLMHLWSLAIEEQFYILTPPLLWIAFKNPRGIFKVIICLTVLSFTLNLFFLKSHPIHSFYWPFTRFWELWCGVALAWLLQNKKTLIQQYQLSTRIIWIQFDSPGRSMSLQHLMTNAMSVLGLMLLVYGIMLFDEKLPYPSSWTLVPIIGSALVITAGPATWLNRTLLANRISIWFGLISYPLYLWHWPVLSFLHIIEGTVPSREIRIIAVLVSICLAWLTYRYVEIPFRFGGLKPLKTIFLLTFLATIGLTGNYIERKHGFGPSGMYGNESFFSKMSDQYIQCQNPIILKNSDMWNGFTRCWQSKKGEPTVILLGDSHAEHLFFGFAETLRNENVAYYIQRGRPSLIDANFAPIFEELLKVDGSGKTVAIATYYLTDVEKYDLQTELPLAIETLRNAGYAIVLLGDTPSFQVDPGPCTKNSRVIFRTKPQACSLSAENLTSQKKTYDPLLKRIAEELNVIYLETNTDLLCNPNCSMLSNDQLYYRDRHHLNWLGSHLFGGDFAKRIRNDLKGTK